MSLQLRDYQEEAIQKLREGFARGHRSQLLYLGTGGGKTEIAIAMLEAARKKGSKAAMILENAGRILGELYEVTEPEILVNLDRLEGVPSLYIRKDVEVTTLNNLNYNAIMYVASNGSNKRLEKRIPMIPKGRSRVLEWED